MGAIRPGLRLHGDAPHLEIAPRAGVHFRRGLSAGIYLLPDEEPGGADNITWRGQYSPGSNDALSLRLEMKEESMKKRCSILPAGAWGCPTLRAWRVMPLPKNLVVIATKIEFFRSP